MKLIHRLKKIANRFANRYGYRIERIVDYSENDINVFEILINQIDPTSPNFFFVEVGANDGCSGDPVHDFIVRYHWRGLLLEPQPSVFEKLVENYRDEKQLIMENVALGKENGVRPIYTLEGSSYLATFDRSVLARRASDSSKIHEIPVHVSTFRSLYDRHAIDRVDLLLVDTEGFDYEVLKMALLDGLTIPRLIRYEHLHLSTADRNACVDLFWLEMGISSFVMGETRSHSTKKQFDFPVHFTSPEMDVFEYNLGGTA